MTWEGQSRANGRPTVVVPRGIGTAHGLRRRDGRRGHDPLGQSLRRTTARASATTTASGSSIADFVHPDDLMRAAEVMTLMADEQLGVPLTPAVYRIRSREETWTPVELNGTVHQNPEPGRSADDRVVVIVGRYSGDRALQDQILELLIAGSSPSEVIRARAAVRLVASSRRPLRRDLHRRRRSPRRRRRPGIGRASPTSTSATRPGRPPPTKDSEMVVDHRSTALDAPRAPRRPRG